MKRISRLARLALPLVLALTLATPHAAYADDGAGTALFAGTGTATPGFDPADPTADTTQTYDIEATFIGTFMGAPFSVVCSFTGGSIGNESLAQGAAGLNGNCPSGGPIGGHVSLTCSGGAGASASVRVVRVAAAAVIQARCTLIIQWDPPPIHINCTVDVYGAAAVVASAPNPLIVSFSLTGWVVAHCTI